MKKEKYYVLDDLNNFRYFVCNSIGEKIAIVNGNRSIACKIASALNFQLF